MITLKSAPNGQKHAAYSELCRIGYIDARESGGWVWHVYLVKPEGGSYMGVVGSVDVALREIETAFASWCRAAGLETKS